MTESPSIYQSRIYTEVIETDNNILVNAVAGSGKTTTLMDCLELIPKKKDIVFLAFNNAIVNELKTRIKRKDVLVTTMHSFCWRILMKSKNFKAELKPAKSKDYITIVFNKKRMDKKRLSYYLYMCSNMIDLMRMTLTTDVVEIIELADRHDFIVNEEEALMLLEILSLMNKDQKTFDFTDMIYRVVIEGLKMPKFDFIFVDESQDLSKVQHAIIGGIKSDKGRMIAVGDPNQAIYGFAGADIDSYFRLKDLFPNTIELPLSVNYRCGREIIELAKELNPAIEAWKGSKKGKVNYAVVEEIGQGDWVLCRNLKPLIYLNIYFLSRGIKSYVKGIEIGAGLIALINKIGSETTKPMLVKYAQMIKREKDKLISLGVKNPDNTDKIDKMRQKYDILYVLSENVYYTKILKEKISKIFREQGEGICLSTMHKSKGLENDNVFIVCPELIPSKYAVQDWQKIQENNLLYVAITRARKQLSFISNYDQVIKPHQKELNDRDLD